MLSVHFSGVLSRFPRRISGVLLHKVSRLSSNSSSVIPSKSVQEALSVIKKNLEKRNETQKIFLGTGQYYTHKVNERVIALLLGNTDSHEGSVELLDTGILSSDIEKLEVEIMKLRNCSVLLTGEVDSVHNGPWAFAFTRSPYFSIFSMFGYNLAMATELKVGPAFRVFNGPLFEDIYLKDVQNVQISLSEEPWVERKLELKLKSGEILTVVEDSREEGSVDLGQLMVSTEWMIKAAGYMCLMARQIGQCSDVVLRLPDPLRAENNPWIELRNNTWTDRVLDNKDA